MNYSLQLQSVSGNIHLHRSATFPGENEAQTYYQAEEYSRKTDGSGRTDYFVIVNGNAGDTIYNLKQHPEFVDFLRSNNIFLFEHRHETYRISTIGHIFNKLPEATNLDRLRDHLEEEMARSRGSAPSESIRNRLELSLNRVYHTAEDESGQKFQGTTLAIQVVCAAQQAKTTRDLLMSGITGNSQVGDFVPRRQQFESPAAYLKVLAQHEHFRRQHSIVRIKDLPEKIMDWIVPQPDQAQPVSVRDRLWAMQDATGPLISSMDPAAQVPDNWFVVVSNQKIAATKSLIHQLFDLIATTELFRSEFGEEIEFAPRVIHREDKRSQREPGIPASRPEKPKPSLEAVIVQHNHSTEQLSRSQLGGYGQ
jgi:hypothetical protein